MELLSPFTLILGAMFSLANVRQAKIAERENVIDIPQSFKVACKAKPFWTMILAIILEALIFLAGVILIGIASALLGAIGYVVALFVDTVAPGIIMLIFLAPGALLLSVYCIIMPLLFAPTPYVIETNPDIGAADAISICFNTMKSRGKGTYFLNLFIPALVEGAILGLGAGLFIVIGFLVPDLRLAIVLAILVCLITFVAFALVAPMFALARKISNKSLFEDIVMDPVNASKRTSGVNIKKCKGVKFDPAQYENELSLLFDETYSDRVPVPETPSARKKRELEERRAVRAASAVSGPVSDATPFTPAPIPEPTPVPSPEPAAPEAILSEPEKAEPIAEEAAMPAEPEPIAEEVSTPVEPATEEVKTEEPAVEEPAPIEPVAEEEATPVESEPAVQEEATPVVPEPADAAEPAEEPAKAPAKRATKTTAKSTKTKKTASESTAEKPTDEGEN